MSMTMTQKILAAHAGLDKVEAGQLILVDVDRVLGNDITSPVAIREYEKIGVKGVYDREKVTMAAWRFRGRYLTRGGSGIVITRAAYGGYGKKNQQKEDKYFLHMIIPFLRQGL